MIEPKENKSGLIKRSVNIAGHRTSVTLEAPFWDQVKYLAAEQGVSLAKYIAEIDEGRTGNLSSALRLAVLDNLLKKGR